MVRALLSTIAVVIYILVITYIRRCIFTNYDKSVYGICWECSWIFELKDSASITLVALLGACIMLGRHVSYMVNTCSILYISRHHNKRKVFRF